MKNYRIRKIGSTETSFITEEIFNQLSNKEIFEIVCEVNENNMTPEEALLDKSMEEESKIRLI